MALDLEAIKKRVAELSGVKKSSNVQMWKPEIGEYKIRCLPCKQAQEGQPILERYYYYIGDNKGILAPHQFGKPDPINDLIRKLYSSGKSEDKDLANKLRAKMRAYVPVIVRGQEDKGVMIWSMGKPVYQRLLSFFIDEEVGDILSPTDGFDLKVSITHTPGKMFKGKPSLDTTVDPARRPSKLHDDPAVAQKWLESIPNIDDMWPLKSTQEIEAILNNWLSGGATAEETHAGGTTRGPTTTDDLDNLVGELKQEKSAAPVVEEKKPAKKTDSSKKKQTLDEAFDELMEE